MAAPSLFLEPNMMQTVLLYAFAAAVLGGMDSPIGAVVGGLAARRAAQPRRHVRALDRRRAAARGRARGDPRRAARPAGRPLRPRGGEARMRVKLLALVARRARARRAAVPALATSAPCSSRPSARTSSRSSASTCSPATAGRSRSATARSWRSARYTTAILMANHGVRDLWTIPIAAVRRRRDRLARRRPGAAALGPLPRARDVRDRGRRCRRS